MGFKIHEINSRKDVNNMQKDLLTEESLDKVYVAVELAENMIDAGETGEIMINGTQVVNVIHDKTKIATVKEAVEQAKFYKKNSINSRIGEKKGNCNLGGKGLLSILYSGWDISVEECSRDYRITATKCSA